MKKLTTFLDDSCSYLPTISLKMKLTILFFSIALFQLQAESLYSQKTKIDLKLKGVPVQKVIETIESKTEFKFLYIEDELDLDRNVHISVKKQKIDKILKKVFNKGKINYKVINKQIVLTPNTNREQSSVEPIALPKTIEAEPDTGTLVEVPMFDVSGTVVDESGEPLVGANVVEKGTTNGTQTDFDGNFSLAVADANSILEVTYLGYTTKEIPIEGRATISVVMDENAEELDEVVVVGYTSTTKKKLTSSVSSVNAEKELQEIPATSLSNAVAGRFTGVNISQATGKPGQPSSIQIRGATNGQFGGSPVLYVIDNVIASKEIFDALDVNEVADVSILKDAAATAAYGSRGANGVVLVTTRSGKKGKASINITSTIGTTEPTQILEWTTPYEHAQLINYHRNFSSNGNPNPEQIVTQTELDYLRDNNFGSFVDQFEQNPILTRNAVNISGGSERVTYFLAGSYIKETGNFKNIDFEKTNFRAKVNTEVAKGLNVGLNMSYNNNVADEFYWRWNGTNEAFADFYRTATRQGRWAPAEINGLPVANFNGWNAGNIINEGQGSNERKTRNQSIILDISYDIPFVEGLQIGASYNRTNTTFNRHLVRTSLIDYTFAADPNNRFLLTEDVIGTRVRSDDGANTNSVRRDNSDRNTSQLNFKLNYNHSFGDHDINASAIYEEWEGEYLRVRSTRRGLVSPSLPEFSGTSPDLEDQLADSRHNDIGRQSVIGLLGWTYLNRYFINGSFRADASVHFVEGNRWGYFPAVSVGWIASDENFFRDNINFIDFFKLKFSIGETGNDNIFGLEDILVGTGPQLFPYVQPFGFGAGAVLGNSDAIVPGTFLSGLANPNTTWNTQTSINYGFEAHFLDSRLKSSIEFYKNERRGIFGNRIATIPVSSGLPLLPENFAGIDIKGIDFETSFTDNIGKLNFEAAVLFGYTDDEYVIIDEDESLRDYQRLLGHGTNRAFGYQALGIIRTQEQLDQLLEDGYSFRGQTPMLGEVYFADIRGNAADDPNGNTPDGIVDENDRTWIADRTQAPINYGLRLSLSYKNFSLQAFAQGFEGHHQHSPAPARWTFAGFGQAALRDWLDSWTEENPNAALPRFGSRNNGQQSTFFLNDSGFLRLKNLNLGYDMPDNVSNAIGAKNINVFINTTNLFFFYRDIKSWDPEVEGSGIPVNKSYSIGLNVIF